MLIKCYEYITKFISDRIELIYVTTDHISVIRTLAYRSNEMMLLYRLETIILMDLL